MILLYKFYIEKVDNNYVKIRKYSIIFEIYIKNFFYIYNGKILLYNNNCGEDKC